VEIKADTLDVIFEALAEQLMSLGAQYEIVIIGGSALTALGLVKRATKDVDLLAIAENGELRSAEPLPDSLRIARDRVARDFSLDEKWLNSGPTSILVGSAGWLLDSPLYTALRPSPDCALCWAS
jgi:Nucleotidyltransferase of unknown function (DUF6036)